MDLRLATPFTATQQLIAAGILAGKTYAEIAVTLPKVGGGHPTARTVRWHVAQMANRIVGLEVLDPRQAVFTFFKFKEWHEAHPDGR